MLHRFLRKDGKQSATKRNTKQQRQPSFNEEKSPADLNLAETPLHIPRAGAATQVNQRPIDTTNLNTMTKTQQIRVSKPTTPHRLKPPRFHNLQKQTKTKQENKGDDQRRRYMSRHAPVKDSTEALR